MENKIRYCPKCKSVNVRIDITTTAALGVPQKWECMKCGFESYAIFPERDIEEIKTEK